MNENKKFTHTDALKMLNQAFKIILNQNSYHYIENTKKKIDLDMKKSLYKGFYTGFNFLMRSPNVKDDIKYDLITKKQLVDLQYTKNIENIENINLNLKIFKNIANKKNTKIFRNEANKYLNNKTIKLNKLNALILKQKVAELSSTEKNLVNELSRKISK
jgi:hypothetical protein